MVISRQEFRVKLQATFEKLVQAGKTPSQEQTAKVLAHTGYDPDYAVDAFNELNATGWVDKCTCICHTSPYQVMHVMACC